MSAHKSCLPLKPFVLSLSKHERRWLVMTSAIPFILRQAQDERDSLNLLAKYQDFICLIADLLLLWCLK
jgi:hypothetical protein